MKNTVITLLLTNVLAGCATSNPSNTSTAAASTNTISPEAEARNITNQMKTTLNLDAAQEDKILMTNVVNLKVLRKLKETQDHDLIQSTQEKYKVEVQNILNPEQYQKFLVSFPSL